MDSLIFDIDGTLWDSTDRVAIAWTGYLKKHGIDITITGADLKPLFGMLLDDIGASLMPWIEPARRHKLVEECCIVENNYLLENPAPVFDGVAEMLRELSKRFPLFIVSNCQAGYIETFLEGTGLTDLFRGHLCPGDTGLDKAGNLIRIREQYNLKAPWYVGDTMGDFLSCVKAGVPFIHAGYGFGHVPDARFRISSPAELPLLAARLSDKLSDKITERNHDK